MSDKNKPEIRMRHEDRDRLRELKQDEDIRKQAVEEGIVDSADRNLTYEEILLMMIPEDGEPLSWSMVTVTSKNNGARDRIQNLAGNYVAAHDVIHHYLTEFDKK